MSELYAADKGDEAAPVETTTPARTDPAEAWAEPEEPADEGIAEAAGERRDPGDADEIGEPGEHGEAEWGREGDDGSEAGSSRDGVEDVEPASLPAEPLDPSDPSEPSDPRDSGGTVVGLDGHDDDLGESWDFVEPRESIHPEEPAETPPDDSAPLPNDPADPEGAFLDKAWGRVRSALFEGKPVEQVEDLYATVDRPNFNEMYIEEIGVPLVVYGFPLERPDGGRVPLFDGPPRRDQTEQGSLGDCGVIAALGAVAGHGPDDIVNCVQENDDGTYAVTLHQVRHTFDGDWSHYEATGGKTVLTVTPDLPVSAMSPDNPAYAATGGGQTAWVAVMEKALAGVDQTWGAERSKRGGGYLRLDHGSSPDIRAEILTQLTGRPAYTENFPKSYDFDGRSPDRQLMDTLREKLASGFPVLVGTNAEDPKKPDLDKGLIPGHAYEVTAVNEKGEICLRNPHNVDQEPVTLDEFKKNFKNRYTTLE